MSGQWEPGLIIHACAMTEEGQEFLSLDKKQIVAVINPEEDIDSVAGLAGSQNQNNNEELPEEEVDSEEARQFGERNCAKDLLVIGQQHNSKMRRPESLSNLYLLMLQLEIFRTK